MAKLGYTTETELENYLMTDIDSSFSTQVDSWIEQIENYINRETGRVFIADVVASERWYDGEGTRRLFLDESISITEIKTYDIDGAEVYDLVEDTDYIVTPYNELPIRELHIKNGEYKLFDRGQKNIKVTAKWGYSVEVPPEITRATTILVAGIINFGNNSNGEVASEKIGDYSVSYKDEQKNDYNDAISIINSFKKSTRYV